jgi:hypothetical protein
VIQASGFSSSAHTANADRIGAMNAAIGAPSFARFVAMLATTRARDQ